MEICRSVCLQYIACECHQALLVAAVWISGGFLREHATTTGMRLHKTNNSNTRVDTEDVHQRGSGLRIETLTHSNLLCPSARRQPNAEPGPDLGIG